MEALTPDYVLVGLLLAQPCHGYQLLDVFRQPQQLGRVWQLSHSQVYAVLKPLESKGWIVGEVLTSAEVPPRTHYQPSTLGQDHFEGWLYQPEPVASIRRIRVEFLSRLYLARLLNRPTFAIVQAQKASCLQAKHTLQQQVEGAHPGIERLSLEL
jgi:DNA-binding PadR family transcriptional regulator